MIFPRLLGAVLVVTPLAGMGQACGGNDTMTGVADAKLPEGVRSEALSHEGCSESGNRVEVLDTNNDGKPDIRRVFDKSGHELCRVVDLDHDGRPDMYEYFDASGTVRRREFCYDDTGVVNAIEYYEGGKLVRREYDTTGLHRIDTWDWFDPGAALDAKTGRPAHPSRRERDTTGDGRVDQWWTWNGDKVTIAVDTNGDGKPDPASVLTLGGGDADAAGAVGAPPAPAAASTDAAAAASDEGGAAAAASDDAGGSATSAGSADGGK
jgi:hypothetical protein